MSRKFSWVAYVPAIPLVGGALGHVVEQRLPGRADDGDDVGALPRGRLGLRDVLVDVAGGDDEVDPRLLGRVAEPSDEPLPRAARCRSMRADARRRPLARAAVRAAASVAALREPEATPSRRPTSGPAGSRSSASPRRRASQTGVVTPCSSPTSSRTASTRWLTHGTRSWSAPAQAGQAQRRPLDRDGGVLLGHPHHRPPRAARQGAGPAHQGGVEVQAGRRSHGSRVPRPSILR